MGCSGRRLARIGGTLGRYGFDVEAVLCDLSSPAEWVRSEPPRSIVVDAPPPVTGQHIDLIYSLRRRWQHVPLVAVTASDDASVLTSLLAIGVDEFSSHTSKIADLVVRLRRQLDRVRTEPDDGSHDAHGLWCDVVRHTIRSNGHSISLTTREFALYSCLAGSPNSPVTRDRIIRSVWGENACPSQTASLGVYVYHLRRKLAKLGFRDAVRTVRGMGYMLLERELSS